VHSTATYLLPSGSTAIYTCGGTQTHWVYQMDWSTGFPVWSASYGSSNLNGPSNYLTLHPTKKLFCGFICGISSFGANCDLDFTAGTNTGDSNPAPGNPSNYWSLFAFCQNVSSSSTIPPAWTHTMSSSGADGSVTWVAAPRNRWGGNDMLIQAVSRGRVGTAQGLVWPATGTFLLPCCHPSRVTLKHYLCI